MTDWRENCPLNGAEGYLWRQMRILRRLPDAHPLRRYYEDGWEIVHHLEDLLFAGGQSFGLTWPGPHRGPLFRVGCSHPGCREAVYALINIDEEGREVPEGKRFFCHDHYYEDVRGEKYVPPTLDEMRHSMALSRATERMYNEQPPQPGGAVHFVVMDRPYLERLVELCKEEYALLCQQKPQ